MAVLFETILRETRQKLSWTMDDGVSLSFPLPDWQNGRKTDRMFLYRRSTRSLEGPRPFALLTLDFETGAPLAYADARIEDFMGDAHGPWNAKISYALPAGISVRDVQEEQAMLRKLYEGVRCLAFQDQLTEPERELLEKFVFLMDHAGPEGLRPYYEAMGKNFYEWVKKHV